MYMQYDYSKKFRVNINIDSNKELSNILHCAIFEEPKIVIDNKICNACISFLCYDKNIKQLFIIFEVPNRAKFVRLIHNRKDILDELEEIENMEYRHYYKYFRI